MKLADRLKMDVPLPTDPFEALVMTRARIQRLTEITITSMRALYPDYETVVAQIGRQEDALTASLGSFTVVGADS